MSRFLTRIAIVVGLVWVVAPRPAFAQVTRSEPDLIAAVAQAPQNVGNYLDLVKLYVDQGRFDEAEQMLARAGSVIRQLQQGNAVATSPTGAQVIRVGGNISAPRKIRDVKPVYPDSAKGSGIEGVVILEAVIGPQGTVTDTKVLRSIPALDEAAIDAVRQWVFTPTLLNGAPVSVIMTVTVNFTAR